MTSYFGDVPQKNSYAANSYFRDVPQKISYIVGRLGCLLVVFLLATGMVWGQAVTVELRANAVPAGRYFTLGDVAYIRGEGRSVRQQLGELIVGITPRMGYSTRITREVMQAQVGRMLPALRERVRWTGATAVVLRGVGQEIAADRLLDLAAVELGKRFDGRYKSMELRPVGELKSVTLPQGKVELSARFTPADALSKRQRVWIDIQLDGQPYRAVPVWFEAKATAPVWVAKATRQPGELVRRTDFVAEVQDVTAFVSEPLSADDLGAPARLRFKQAVGGGGPLLRTHVEERPAVARNDTVAVILSHGGIAIETSGVVLADGRIGDVVKVRNTRSKEHFNATVISAGAVMIDGR